MPWYFPNGMCQVASRIKSSGVNGAGSTRATLRVETSPDTVRPVSSSLTVVVVTAALLTALWTAITAAMNRAVGRTLLGGLAVVELLLAVQLVVGVVSVLRGDGPDATVTFIAYLVGTLLILPVAALWSLAERSRPSVLVLTLGCLAVAVMTARLMQIWNADG